ncbi:hypothetical protein [Streptosporangium amethystogenes]|uniref:hypothetical protein n=1 Tax=Streptosporangium amethystogenes TaxID=2002 RepID=UPI0012FC88CD|nr:hypothetical protein [Streptosporangium amethystogenes]
MGDLITARERARHHSSGRRRACVRPPKTSTTGFAAAYPQLDDRLGPAAHRAGQIQRRLAPRGPRRAVPLVDGDPFDGGTWSVKPAIESSGGLTLPLVGVALRRYLSMGG